MADQDVAVEAEVNAGEGANKKEPEAPEYEPGVLCAIEAPPETKLDFDDQEISAIKTLNRKVAMRDMPSRREQLVRVWEARLFDRGFQHLLPRQNGGWEIPSVGSGYGPGEDEDRSAWEIDVYSSYRKIICAALTREVPGVLFEPSDQDDDRDITAAASADKLKSKISRDNKMKELQGEAARFLWTDGIAVHLSRYVLDAQGFGYEPPPRGDVPEDEETGEAATEIKGNEVPGNERGAGEPAEAGGNAGDSAATDAGEQKENAEAGPEESRTPRGHELITVAGALNWKLPIKANCLKECGYARYSYEIATSLAKAQYPDKEKDIKPSRSGSDGGSGGDDLERLARINVMLGVEDNFITEDSAVYDVTMQKYFYRPEALFDIDDKAVRASLLKKCPKGLYVTFAGEVFCEGRNASMDDHVAITFADAGDGAHRPGLGTPLIAPQKILNTCAELAYEYFVHGVPMTYMDDEMFDTEAVNDEENLVGGIRPFEATGTQIDGIYWFREEPVPFPEQLIAFVAMAHGRRCATDERRVSRTVRRRHWRERYGNRNQDCPRPSARASGLALAQHQRNYGHRHAPKRAAARREPRRRHQAGRNRQANRERRRPEGKLSLLPRHGRKHSRNVDREIEPLRNHHHRRGDESVFPDLARFAFEPEAGAADERIQRLVHPAAHKLGAAARRDSNSFPRRASPESRTGGARTGDGADVAARSGVQRSGSRSSAAD